MAERKKHRIGLIILISAAALIVFGAIWYYLPLRYPIDTRIEPYDVVGYFEASLDPDRGLGGYAVELARRRVLGPDSGRMMRIGFNLFTSTAFPRSVNGWLVAEAGETLPAAIAVIDIGRPVRALRLFDRLILARTLFGSASRTERVGDYRLRTGDVADSPIAAYAFVGDAFLVSTSRAALSSLFHALDTGAAVRPAVAEALSEPDAALRLYMTNRAGSLTDVVRGVEERVAFAALPSVDALSSIRVAGDIAAVVADGATGPEGEYVSYQLAVSMLFSHTDAARAGEVYSDARFLYGTLRRVARSQEIDLRGDITETEDSVGLELTAGGLEALFEPSADEEAGGGE